MYVLWPREGVGFHEIKMAGRYQAPLLKTLRKELRKLRRGFDLSFGVDAAPGDVLLYSNGA